MNINAVFVRFFLSNKKIEFFAQQSGQSTSYTIVFSDRQKHSPPDFFHRCFRLNNTLGEIKFSSNLSVSLFAPGRFSMRQEKEKVRA